MPDVHFVIRQDAIEMPQRLGVHRLKYHGQREAANLRFLMMAAGTDCVLQSAYSSRSYTQFVST